jgi:hypothetical protein
MCSYWNCLVVSVFVVSFVAVHQVEADDLSAEDHLEINQLYASYVQAIDLGDAIGWANAFTLSGSFDSGDSTVGRDNLIAFAERYHENNGPHPRHWYNGLVITPTADGAEGKCYALTFNVKTRSVMWTGTYKDVLVKTSKGWRFSSRHLTIETPATGESGKMWFLTGQ